MAGLLCAPVGGGPPASRPRRELRSARRLEARPGPATAHGRRSQAPPPPTGIVNLSRETGVAFARAGRASDETDIAFAGEKKLFWARFSVAEVMVVSTVAVWGRALVMAVSTSPRHSCLCAKKFALLGLMVGVSAKKFAQRTKNGPKSVVYGVLGEFFRENTAGGVTPGEVFRG